MAWTPSPEVAVARDAAKALGDAPVCIVIWVDKEGKQLGVASYGRTRELCTHAKALGETIHEAALKWGT